jgi:1,3-beta-glucan synthase
VPARSATAEYGELSRVIGVIRKMLVTTEAEATPQSDEAQRILGFFINSLGHPSLDKPSSIDKMWSWSIMTPMYEEDVLYALDRDMLGESA